VRAAAARALGAAWMREAAASPGGGRADALRHAVRVLAGAGADDRLADAYHLWRADARASGDPRDDHALALDLLGVAATPARVRALLASRPWSARLRASARARVPVGLAAGAVVLAAAAAAAAGRDGAAERPARLAVLTVPIGWTPGLSMSPAPIVEVVDARGRPVLDAGDSVHVRVEQPGAVLGGATASPVVRGRARLDRAILLKPGDGPLRVVFTYPGVPPLSLAIPTSAVSDLLGELRLLRGVVNGRELSPTQRVATVAPGAPLELELDLRYTSPWPAANVVLGATPTWGDPATSFVRLSSLVTPAAGYAVHARCTLTAPARPGTYHVIVAFGAEENVAYLLSGTNWTVGRPVWGDGNDVAGWSAAQIAEANHAGSAPSVLLERRGGAPASGVVDSADRPAVVRLRRRTAATAIEVRVLPAPDA
jgi:hypothetical protein